MQAKNRIRLSSKTLKYFTIYYLQWLLLFFLSFILRIKNFKLNFSAILPSSTRLKKKIFIHCNSQIDYLQITYDETIYDLLCIISDSIIIKSRQIKLWMPCFVSFWEKNLRFYIIEPCFYIFKPHFLSLNFIFLSFILLSLTILVFYIFLILSYFIRLLFMEYLFYFSHINYKTYFKMS